MMNLRKFKNYFKSNKFVGWLYPYIKQLRIKSNDRLFRESNCELKKLKNSYDGKRCFIIGNGPSLRKEDLDLLKDEVCIASNKIYLMYQNTEWRPEIYTAQDEIIIHDNYNEIRALEAKHKFLIIPETSKPYDISAIYLRKRLCKITSSNLPLFSTDLSDAVYEGYSIVYTNIQLAVYLGFKEIYLLGVDHSYSIQKNIDGSIQKNENVQNYFDVNYSKKTFESGALNIPRTEETTLAFVAAKKFAEINDIKIFNATRGGKLEVFPRIALEDIQGL